MEVNITQPISSLPLYWQIDLDQSYITPFLQHFYTILTGVIGAIIVLFNSSVVVSSGYLLRKGQEPQSTYLFLGNVALSDFLAGIAVLFSTFYPRRLKTENFCAIQMGIIVSSIITSVYTIGIIAVDRFIYILYGLHYKRLMYPFRARIMLFCTWILGLIIGFLPAMGWRDMTGSNEDCWFIVIAPTELVLITTVIGLFPLILIFILYSIILHRALRKISQLEKAASRTDILVEDQTNGNIRLNTRTSPSKWKAIKMVLLTAGCFFVTWIPYFVITLWYAHCDIHEVPNFCNGLLVTIAYPLALLGLLNSVCNPIIYAWWHNGFRNSMKQIYIHLCGKCWKSDSLRKTSILSSAKSKSSDNVATSDDYIQLEQLTRGA